jgi:acyl phosphate:glycerol-3-phosphate acyltransferase
LVNCLAGNCLIVVVAFLIGSIPVGVLVGRARGVDIRKQGSGNIGATNALRVMGWKVGVPVLLADIAKGVVPVLLARQITHDAPVWVTATGVAAVLGHCFSPFLAFSGGKGVATALGMILALDWRVGLIAIALFIVVMVFTRYVSLGSVLGAGVCWLIALLL